MHLFSQRIVKIAFLLISLLLIGTHAVASEGPLYVDFKSIPVNQLTDKISMRFVTSSQFTVIQWELKAGAKLPAHFHINEQVTRVLDGNVEVQSGDKIYNLHSGDIMIFPPNTPHGFIALSDALLYEQQTPIREDFLKEGFIEKLSEYLKQNQ